MQRPFLFALLFSSWIIGITLICLFPPVPDYDTIDEKSSYLSQDSFPEIHQRNAAQESGFQLDYGFEFSDSSVDFKIDQVLSLYKGADAVGSLSQVSSFFNTWILFKAFFETW